VSYEELAAFVSNANQLVPNDLFRPKVFMGAPAHDLQRPVWRMPARGRTLEVPAEHDRRFTIRDSHGVRVLDVNKEDQTPLRLLLPAGTLSLEEMVQSHTANGRPVLRQRLIREGDSKWNELAPPADVVAARGEAPVFASLFSAPFGKRALIAQRELLTQMTTPPNGITLHDVERLKLHLQAAGESARQIQVEHALGYAFEGAFFMGLATLWVNNAGISCTPSFGTSVTYVCGPADARPMLYSELAVGALWGGLGTLFTLIGTPDEKSLLKEFQKQDVQSEASRSKAVVDFERKLQELALAERTSRIHWGIGQLVTGVILGGGGAWLMASKALPEVDYWFVTAGGIFLVHSVWNLALRRGAAEIAWEAYQEEPEFRNAPRAPDEPRFSVAPVSFKSGAGVALAFSF
jgi:hypothetical protein